MKYQTFVTQNIKIKALLIFLLLFCFVFCSCGPDNVEYYIFSDINECCNFEVNKHDGAEIIIFDSPDEDKYLNDLEYVNFFAADYQHSEFDFKIFAYEFQSAETAKKYFENATGRASEIDTNFLASGGMTKYEIVAIDWEKAYVLFTSAKNSKEVNEFLKINFSKKLTEKM